MNNFKFFVLCTLFMIVLLVFVPWNTVKSKDSVETINRGIYVENLPYYDVVK
ncbi:hypothetical protein RZN25_12155 [Bacillaceae bacterium S4-13-56]